jgi:hypothetical protein
VQATFEKRLLIVWLLLSAITVSQLAVGAVDGGDTLRPDAVITSGAILIALFKVRLIFREFMEVRHAPVLLGRLTDLWLLLTAVALLGTYFAGTAFSG